MPENSTNELGNYLRQCRRQALRGKPLSLVRASDLLGYDKNSLQAYEVGGRLPDVQFLAHASKIYKSDFRYMLSLLLRAQTVRGSNLQEQDLICVEAADRIQILDHEKVLNPESLFAKVLNYEVLARVLHTVELAENRTRLHLSPKHKARIISALYGVASLEGPDYDLGIEYLLRIMRDSFKEYLE